MCWNSKFGTRNQGRALLAKAWVFIQLKYAINSRRKLSGFGMKDFGAKMQALMESCPGKTAVSGVMGFALGGAFGLFMASMQYDTPLHTPGSAGATVASLPLREQLKAGLRDMGARSFSSAKNFGKVGAIFAGTECCIEGFRAKNDLANGVLAGCITGGVLAAPAGPQAAALGCAGFAAFSAAIDAYMRRPSEVD
ncbi:Mitochondrial import inner membrane translocase subunit tim22 [Cadophora gregata]|uniref:Mitochondrial import inner membrane translocase subunit tim22 n=1 Tax=Cadophora gregata TaxID=51156 RepID=UPI0026DD5B92|nr:Mitochondrial import inner membrane translocase subunit tim22 [Cadophora gregata]KAK0117916.1 Mitochondrial import inner membrane translocase subunit tim22 [Cadophora gregata]KAK0122978.1 Mitochondrial import inner membrane translocase subunit tim22 [Cadophora gregata f. sp. sojae]